jgi:hypothetical protein
MPVLKQTLRTTGGVSLSRVVLTGRNSLTPIETSYEVESVSAGLARVFGNLSDADQFFRSQLSEAVDWNKLFAAHVSRREDG